MGRVRVGGGVYELSLLPSCFLAFGCYLERGISTNLLFLSSPSLTSLARVYVRTEPMNEPNPWSLAASDTGGLRIHNRGPGAPAPSTQAYPTRSVCSVYEQFPNAAVAVAGISHGIVRRS